MAETSLHVQGLTKLLRDLEKAGVDLQDMRDAMARISNAAMDVIRPHIPVDSGALRATLRAGRGKNKAVARAGGAAARYAPIVNYGRSGGWGGVARDTNRRRNRSNIVAGHRYEIEDGARYMQEADKHTERWAQMLNEEVTQLLNRSGLS